MLYEIAILTKPSKKESEDGKSEELIFGPKAIVARSEQSAVIAAVLAAQKEPTSASASDFDINKVEVLIRPFA